VKPDALDAPNAEGRQRVVVLQSCQTRARRRSGSR